MSLENITNEEIVFIITTFQRFVMNCKKKCDCPEGCKHCYAHHFLNDRMNNYNEKGDDGMTDLTQEDTISIIKVDQDDIIAIFTDFDDAKEFLKNTPKRYGYRLEIYQHTNTYNKEVE